MFSLAMDHVCGWGEQMSLRRMACMVVSRTGARPALLAGGADEGAGRCTAVACWCTSRHCQTPAPVLRVRCCSTSFKPPHLRCASGIAQLPSNPRTCAARQVLLNFKRHRVEDYCVVVHQLTAQDLTAFMPRLLGRVFLEAMVAGTGVGVARHWPASGEALVKLAACLWGRPVEAQHLGACDRLWVQGLGWGRPGVVQGAGIQPEEWLGHGADSGSSCHDCLPASKEQQAL
jgi:hypothetical protein